MSATEECKRRVLKALELAGENGSTANFLQHEIGDTENLIIAAMFELHDEGKIGPGQVYVKGPDDDQKTRLWFVTALIPKPTLGQERIKRPRKFTRCPKCRGHRFRTEENGGALCLDCGLKQLGLFEAAP